MLTSCQKNEYYKVDAAVCPQRYFYARSFNRCMLTCGFCSPLFKIAVIGFRCIFCSVNVAISRIALRRITLFAS